MIGADNRRISSHRLRRALGVGVILVLVVAVFGLYHYQTLSNGSISSKQSSAQPRSRSLSQISCIDKLPAALKIGQKLMISATADTLGSVSAVATRYNLGGVILMDQVPASNVQSYKVAQPLAPLVATDQEGGEVQRYKSVGPLPSEQLVASEMTPTQAEKMVEADDKYLVSQGVNMNLAPVVDVAPTEGESVLSSRIFSSQPGTVSAYAAAYVHAGINAGILPTIKHFPGLGSASGNTDDGPAAVPNFGQLQTRDLIPYRKLAGTDVAVMVGNQTVPGLTGGLPASLSRSAVTNELRDGLGYRNNLVITDSLNAKAISEKFDLPAAAVDAWEAGDDIALIVQVDPSTIITTQQIKDILSRAQAAINAGQLKMPEIDASVQRIFQLPQKQIDACKQK